MTDTVASLAPPDSAMPNAVWVSVATMLVQVPIGLISALFFQSVEIGIATLVVMVVATVAALGLIALLAFGYGWVRHFYAVCAVLSLPRLVSFMLQSFHSAPMNGAWVLAANLWPIPL